jgi:hypothetical protein
MPIKQFGQSRVTFNAFAASLTERCKGFKQRLFTIMPGCLGLCIIVFYLPLVIIKIFQQNGILPFKSKNNTPITLIIKMPENKRMIFFVCTPTSYLIVQIFPLSYEVNEVNFCPRMSPSYAA